jgi:hypothetical protein
VKQSPVDSAGADHLTVSSGCGELCDRGRAGRGVGFRRGRSGLVVRFCFSVEMASVRGRSCWLTSALVCFCDLGPCVAPWFRGVCGSGECCQLHDSGPSRTEELRAGIYDPVGQKSILCDRNSGQVFYDHHLWPQSGAERDVARDADHGSWDVIRSLSLSWGLRVSGQGG